MYRCQRLLTRAHERLDRKGRTKRLGLLEAGDPKGEVRMAWHAKENSARYSPLPILAARRALDDWLHYASRSRLGPFVKLARTIRIY